jgi:hypothetical protein
VQPVSKPVIKITCGHCGEDTSKDKAPFTCKHCLIHICAMCCSVGYNEIHEQTCQNVCTRLDYVCTCGRDVEIKNCETCSNYRISQYFCFNCTDEKKAAAWVCDKCQNYFTCSSDCYLNNLYSSSNHASSCSTLSSSTIACRHGRPIFIAQKTKCCKMCTHGNWTGYCILCITLKHIHKGDNDQR